MKGSPVRVRASVFTDLQEKALALTPLRAGFFEHIPANACSKAFAGTSSFAGFFPSSRL
jgi:hypothetical protein